MTAVLEEISGQDLAKLIIAEASIESDWPLDKPYRVEYLVEDEHGDFPAYEYFLTQEEAETWVAQNQGKLRAEHPNQVIRIYVWDWGPHEIGVIA